VAKMQLTQNMQRGYLDGFKNICCILFRAPLIHTLTHTHRNKEP